MSPVQPARVPMNAVFADGGPAHAGASAKALPGLPGPVAAADGSPAPLSFTQEGVWFIDRLEGPSGINNMARALRLRGPLNAARLERSLQALVARHESLRTAFELGDGSPIQVILPPHEASQQLRLTVLQVEGADPADREQELGERLHAAASEPFDLARAPLLRTILLRLNDAEHALLLVVHQIVFDGWSMGLLLRELGALYDADADAGVLPALPLQFADVVRWQRAHVASESATASLAYWRHQLEGVETLELPTDRPRAARFSYRGRVHRFTLSALLARQLRQVAQAERVSLFTVLLAAFKLLLMRYTRQSDVAVGVAVAGRPGHDLGAVVGCLVNTLVLRSDLAGNPSFTELLRRVHRTVGEAHEHEDLPFDRLVAALSPARDLSRNPLYQVAFALNHADAHTLSLRQLDVDEVPLHNDTAKLDLSLAFTEQQDGGIGGVLEYATELFDGATIGRMASHLRELLRGIAAAPRRALGELPLLGMVEREEMLVSWNETAHPYPQPAGLQQLVEAQAARSPEAIALVFGDRSLSYGELNVRANQLARRLVDEGVGPDVAVGLCVERSLDLPVAALAILKAGGVYVPLDPADPADRRSFVLSDCAARVIVTQARLKPQFDADGTRRLLCLDDEAAGDPADRPTHDLDTRTRPEQVAYLIYTSGSTGRPKGVQVPHRGICNHVQWMADTLRLAPGDRVLQKTSIGFDASLVELFAPLTRGATAVLAEVDGERDTRYLVRAIESHQITIIQMVPSALRLLLQEPGLERCRRLRYLICGGEALDRDLARDVQSRLPLVQLGNFYGPTEASIDATWQEVRVVPPGQGTVPIGRPVANMRCHVLDAGMNPVPVGVLGELYVGGVGLAQGYLNQPALTAERFVDDPFRPGERLYRTGDLARYLVDGRLECAGRVDDQIKLRGFRIELGEVEAVLNAIDGVTHSAVVVREDRPGLRQLVAYVVSDFDDAGQVREQLRDQLPEHMVPAAVVRLPELPRLPNGKLDRRALPAPVQSRAADRVEPGTPTERVLAAIWCELLGLDRIDATDDFFDLGGHSLLAVRMVRRVEQQLQQRCSLPMLFRARTLQRVAAELDHAASKTPERERRSVGRFGPADESRAIERAELLALQPNGTGPALFCICGVHLYQQLANRLAPHVRVYGIFLPYEQALLEAGDGASAHLPSVEEMAADYVRAIRSQQPSGPYYLTGVSYGGVLAFEIAQQLSREGEQIAFLAMLDSLLERSIPRNWLRWVVRRVQGARDASWRQLADRVVRRLRGRGGDRPAAAPGDSYHHIVAVRDRIYATAMQSYTPAPYSGPAILVRADQEMFDAADGVDESYGWSRLIPGLRVHDAPGDHLGILSEPNVASLASFMSTQVLSAGDTRPAELG